MFAVDPAFAAGAEPRAGLALCEVWLQRDARYPWLILVPQREHLAEIDELAPNDAAVLMREMAKATRVAWINFACL